MTDGRIAPEPVLLADIGGTHARFALRLPDGTITESVDLPSAAYRDLAGAAKEGLSLLWKPLPLLPGVNRAAVAVAGPITGDDVRLTNVGWSFSIEATRRALGLERLTVINDLAALAWAIPTFEGKDKEAFIEGKGKSQRQGEDEHRYEAAESGATVAAVVAVGTGLGAAAWVRSSTGGEVVLASEGGHRDLAAASEREWRVVERLRARFGAHVSAERAVSGAGLANLWQALAELDGEPAANRGIAPEEVTRSARAGLPRALEAVDLFAGWLGAFAGDLALTVGARGGVWLGGGVLAALGPTLDREAVRRRFLAKGRFEEWIGEVPLRTIDDPLAAFRGLGRALDAH